MSRTISTTLLAALVAAGCASEQMAPGQRCGSCHGSSRAQAFTAAGTVYGDRLADPDDGLEGARLEITDARGTVLTLRSNQAGNFFTGNRLVPPFQVIVTRGDARAAMPNAPHGDCNACHTAAVPGPGHIHVP